MVKNVPVSWITPDGHDVTEEMLDYLRPLIVSEPSVSYKKWTPGISEPGAPDLNKKTRTNFPFVRVIIMITQRDYLLILHLYFYYI